MNLSHPRSKQSVLKPVHARDQSEWCKLQHTCSPLCILHCCCVWPQGVKQAEVSIRQGGAEDGVHVPRVSVIITCRRVHTDGVRRLWEIPRSFQRFGAGVKWKKGCNFCWLVHSSVQISHWFLFYLPEVWGWSEWVKWKQGYHFCWQWPLSVQISHWFPLKKNLICLSRSGDQMDRCMCCWRVQTDRVWCLWKLRQSLQMFGDEESKIVAWFHFCQWHLSFQISHWFHFFYLTWLSWYAWWVGACDAYGHARVDLHI